MATDDRMLTHFDSTGTVASGASSTGLSGLSLFAPALTGLIGLSGNLSQLQANHDSAIRTMENDALSLKYSQNVKAQQLKDIDRIVGDKLSATGLEALKAESRLKAAAAETGGTGTTNQDAIATADVNRLHQDAVILRNADVAKANKLSELTAERLGFTIQNDALNAGIEEGSVLSGLSSFVSNATTGLNFMTETQKEKFFGIEV